MPPALAAWGTAAVMLHAPPGRAAGTVIAALLTAGALLVGRGRLTGRGRATAHAVAAVLLCVAAAAGSAGLHGADLRRGPVPALAREYARVTAEVEITSDPGSPGPGSAATTWPRRPY
ncbi:hypothetical protein SHKM778_78450 [Streptomyces sp. KM77-8]|uniref:Uncharacterized protein n=1 Tax=Streptomyces haneummycinicus TaxID=3074435 RepID=A0AAT9HVC2_9ACTN